MATDIDMGLAFPNKLDIDIVALKIFIYIVCYVAELITSCVNCVEFRHYIQWVEMFGAQVGQISHSIFLLYFTLFDEYKLNGDNTLLQWFQVTNR